MKLSILSFILSALIILCLVRYQHIHENISRDSDLSGPQKFHTHNVSRIGGLGIFFSILITGFLAFNFFKLERGSIILVALGCSTPTFIAGLLEDLTKKIDAKTRLTAAATSAGLSGIFMGTWINAIHVPLIDELLAISVISITFTIVAVAGLANAYNIIDGFNGLASMVAIISLFAIGYVAFKVDDANLAAVCMITIGAISGFFIWNYPRGLIFLGDGGAYLIGFLIATLSLLLVNRNQSVSPWFVLLVNIYPTFETLFSIWRRRVHQGRNPSTPDATHFHSLIYRRLIRTTVSDKNKQTNSYTKNAKTSPHLWVLSCLATIPAIIWWDTHWILQSFTLVFCITYIWIYRTIVKFKTLIIFKKLKKYY